MPNRTEDSMGRDAYRATARKKGASGGESNRFANETPGEKRGNASSKKMALKKSMDAFKARTSKNKDIPPFPGKKK